MKVTIWCSVFVHLFVLAEFYQLFQDRIPNGEIVPHPCKPNFLWAGVGHRNRQGGGARNPFGRDFAQNGYMWDECLCQADSDKDGKTNGEELGDPNCVWTPGSIPERTIGLTHPGICEPLGKPECQIENEPLGDICVSDTFVCPAVNGTDAKYMDLMMKEAPVPAKETTYMCQTFLLPDDQDYHMIAFSPILGNINILHHMVLYACSSVGDDEYRDSPKECGMFLSGCTETIAVWSVGIPGICIRHDAGYLLGQNGHIRLMLQAHWNNPLLISDATDSSGMRIYYTPNLRPYDLSAMPVGPMHMVIPPRQQSFAVTSTCGSSCTKGFGQPYYIVSVYPHMHYSGRGATCKIIRNGTEVYTIVDMNNYSYDNPELYFFEEPLELLPGDEIHTECRFRTMNRAGVTLYGDGTNDEMCIMFLELYTKSKTEIPVDCYDFKHRDICSVPGVEQPVEFKDCRFGQMNDFFNVNENTTAAIRKVKESCDITGVNCVEGCQEAIDEVKALDHGCVKNPLALQFTMVWGVVIYENKDFKYAMYSCEEWEYDDLEATRASSNPDGGLCPISEGNTIRITEGPISEGNTIRITVVSFILSVMFVYLMYVYP